MERTSCVRGALPVFLCAYLGCGDTIVIQAGGKDDADAASLGEGDAGGHLTDAASHDEGDAGSNLTDAASQDEGDAGSNLTDAASQDACAGKLCEPTHTEPDGGAVCSVGTVQPCVCAGGVSGNKTCVPEGNWGDCACSDPDAGRDGAVVPLPADYRCKAGYYTGTLQGDWRPSILDLGISQFPVEVDAQETERGPGLSFTLEEKATAPLGEYPTQEVKNGCVLGTMTIGIGDQHPFVASLTGELDCETGKFTGNMDGVYSLFGIAEVVGVPGDDIPAIYAFEGDFGNQAPEHPVIAEYDVASEQLVDGTWDLREKLSSPQSEPGAGGEGVWQASWTAQVEPLDALDCQQLLQDVMNAGN